MAHWVQSIPQSCPRKAMRHGLKSPCCYEVAASPPVPTAPNATAPAMTCATAACMLHPSSGPHACCTVSAVPAGPGARPRQAAKALPRPLASRRRCMPQHACRQRTVTHTIQPGHIACTSHSSPALTFPVPGYTSASTIQCTTSCGSCFTCHTCGALLLSSPADRQALP
jgi:hypothetical protein